MDELTLVRELRPDDEPLPADVRYRARAALRYEAAYERSRPRRPRRALALAVAAALLAVAAAVVVLDDELGDTERVAGRDPGTALAPSSIPRGDQFIYTREVLHETPVGGGRTERFVDEIWRSVDGRRPVIESERGRSWKSAPAGEGVWPPRSYELLERLPTEPDALRRAVAEQAGTDDDMVFIQLVMLLQNWTVMPPGLRTATFEAVSGFPGVRLIENDTDARGRRGIGIVRDGRRLDAHVIVDAETYEYLGFRDTFVRDDGVTVDRVSALVSRGIVDRVGERP